MSANIKLSTSLSYAEITPISSGVLSYNGIIPLCSKIINGCSHDDMIISSYLLDFKPMTKPHSSVVTVIHDLTVTALLPHILNSQLWSDSGHHISEISHV